MVIIMIIIAIIMVIMWVGKMGVWYVELARSTRGHISHEMRMRTP